MKDIPSPPNHHEGAIEELRKAMFEKLRQAEELQNEAHALEIAILVLLPER